MFLYTAYALAIFLMTMQLYFFLKSLIFYKYLYPKVYKPRFANPESFPSVHVLVASKGQSPELEKIARAFASQDYPGVHRVTFITESAQDPGSPLLQTIAESHDHVRHMFAGYTTRCSQKNHNLLKGMEDDHSSDVFAFADADILVGPNWLQQLVAPLTQGKQWVSTGCLSQNLKPPFTITRLIQAAMTTYQSKMVMSVGSIWGASCAIWRETFDNLGTRELWAKSIVDDVSLFQLFQDHNFKHLWGAKRLRLMPIPDLEIETYSNPASLSHVIHWFTRQIMYIKFHRRPIWMLAVLANFFNMMLAFLGPMLLLFPQDTDLYRVGLLSFSFAMSLWVINMSLVLIRPKTECSFLQWSKIFIVGDLVAVISLLSTMFTNRVIWSGISYRVARDGTVEEVTHPNDAVLPVLEGGPKLGS